MLENIFGDWSKYIDTKELNIITSQLSILYKIVGREVLPKKQEVFKAFKFCQCKDCKIVFLSQDPYPQKDKATGIAFGNKEGEKEYSPSLNIIREALDPELRYKFDYTLESWCKQGILMLNSALTIESGKIGSHTWLWRDFIAKFLKNFSESNNGIIFVLWGQQAKTFLPYINIKYNYVFFEKHPAYYARTNSKLSNTIFKKVSELSKSLNGEEIKWIDFE